MLSFNKVFNFIRSDFHDLSIFCLKLVLISLIPFVGLFVCIGLCIEFLYINMKGKFNFPVIKNNFWNFFVLGLKFVLFLFIVNIPNFIIFGFVFKTLIGAVFLDTLVGTIDNVFSFVNLTSVFFSNFNYFIEFYTFVLMIFIPLSLINFCKNNKKFKYFFEFKKIYYILKKNLNSFINAFIIHLVFNVIIVGLVFVISLVMIPLSLVTLFILPVFVLLFSSFFSVIIYCFIFSSWFKESQ